MYSLTAFLLLAVNDPPVKVLPSVKEPDWNTWRNAEPKTMHPALDAWDVLRNHRPDREFRSGAGRREAEKQVEAAYKWLDEHPTAACAAGVERLRTTKIDWERLMIATMIDQLGGDKGKPFLIWAMAQSTTIDEVFEPMFETACRLAAERKPENLPAVFLILRTHDGHVFLRLHSWYIRTHECLFYVLGRYGRGVIPYLRPMLRHNDPYVRRNAAIA